MTAPSEKLQCITALTPVTEVVARLGVLASPVAARDAAPGNAVGKVLADDLVAPLDLPQQALALNDGWALASDQIIDASSYTPAMLAAAPHWVDAGEQIPSGADTIVPFDALTVSQGKAEVFASAAQGEGILPARAEAEKGMIVRKAGNRVRPMDAALMRALKIKTVSVRVPRVKIVALSVRETKADFIGPLIANAVLANGGVPEIAGAKALEDVLSESDHDAVIAIGGTGSGKNDYAVRALARIGKVEVHGLGISPGQTSALGSANGRPVLMLPGRLDAALATFLILGSKLMARLSSASETEAGLMLPLTKKITSTIGLTEVVFVRRNAEGIEPLGGGFFPLRALMQADGWLLVPAGSEGISAGTTAEIRNIP